MCFAHTNDSFTFRARVGNQAATPHCVGENQPGGAFPPDLPSPPGTKRLRREHVAPAATPIVSHGFHSRVNAYVVLRDAAALRVSQQCTVPKCKVTKVFTVEAASKQEAIQKVTDEPGELREFVRVFEQPGSQSESGWKTSLRKQLTGK